MRAGAFLARSLTWYWRTNAAVVGGVAIAVAVLAGALLVGESVRASLRDLVLQRLGRTETVISSATFFRDGLAARLAVDGRDTCPVIALDGIVTHQDSRRRASNVEVYGIDGRFWRFHRKEGRDWGARDALLTSAVAAELGAQAGDSVLVRVEKPSDIPRESLHGRKEDTSRSVRVRVAAILTEPEEFSIRVQQGEVRAIYLPMARLRADLELPGRANRILVAGDGSPEAALRQQAHLEDLGIRLRFLETQNAFQLETASAVIGDDLAAIAQRVARDQRLQQQPMLTYLANVIRAGAQQTPYSLITAIDLPQNRDPSAIVVNDWLAQDLDARVGDTIEIEFFTWKEEGRLLTESASFRLARVVPLRDGPGDRDMAPEYPGITGSESMDEWDPPFPMQLERVRPKDEDYWDNHRTTPKAFLTLERGQQLWGGRFGRLTALRLRPEGGDARAAMASYAKALRDAIDPMRAGFAIDAVRRGGLQAAQGATDFGEYFTYFSVFLVVSALLLSGLFFKLGVEQRAREIGLLRAVGFGPERIRRLFLAEGAALALAGAALGVAGSLGYAGMILLGLRTWWVDAVGTRLLTLHAAPSLLAAGVAGGLTAALCAVWLTLRGLAKASPRALLLGGAAAETAAPARRPALLRFAGGSAVALAVALLALSLAGVAAKAAAFFGAASLLLAGCLCLIRISLDRPQPRLLRRPGAWRMGLRNISYRPGRSVASIALIASAAFLIVAVESFRRDAGPEGPHTGSGGFGLMAQSLLPLYLDLNSPASRASLNIADAVLQDATVTALRLKPGDDASCLNLYRPRNPRILAIPDSLRRSGRFAFQQALRPSANAWLLLDEPQPGGAIGAVVDANSLTYVLQRKLGDIITLDSGARLRVVATLRDSVFQSEILIRERDFLKLFPDEQGFRVFLLDVPPGRRDTATTGLEEALTDYGFDVTSTAERLARFHRVENTYLSTFQMLGALGLLLGTAGLAAVLLRNVLERRRELALLRAVGYRSSHLRTLILAENAALLVAGLLLGAGCALLAVLPTLAERGARLPGSVVTLLPLVLLAGLTASVLATRAALRSPLLEALRSE